MNSKPHPERRAVVEHFSCGKTPFKKLEKAIQICLYFYADEAHTIERGM